MGLTTHSPTIKSSILKLFKFFSVKTKSVKYNPSSLNENSKFVSHNVSSLMNNSRPRVALVQYQVDEMYVRKITDALDIGLVWDELRSQVKFTLFMVTSQYPPQGVK
jgi:hypothetical protein